MADPIRFPYQPRDWAKPLHKLLSSTSTRAIIALVHRRGGKSWFGAASIVLGALTVPGRYGIVGPQQRTMKAIFWPVLQHFLKDVPGCEWRIGDLSVTLPCTGGGTSTISIHSAGDQDSGSNIRGLAFQGLLIDEADQIGEEAFFGEILPTQANLTHAWMVVSGTPRGDQLLASLLRQANATPGWHGFQLGVYDTGVFSAEEVKTLAEATPFQQFAREYLARTDVGTADQLIKIQHVLRALENTVSEHQLKEYLQSYPVIMGVDIGRLNDETVWCLRCGPVVTQFIRARELSTQDIAFRTRSLVEQHGVDATFVDAGSMGISVIDVMRQLHLNPTAVNFGGTADDPMRFSNKRAEMMDRVRAWTERHDASLPTDQGVQLQKELTSPTFSLNSGNKLVIEAKASIKKRLGHSTDALDSLALTFASNVHNPRLDADGRILSSLPKDYRGANGAKYASSKLTAELMGKERAHREFDPYAPQKDEWDPYGDSNNEWDPYS
ncbi:MAG: hypothetical protein AAFO80_08255 [Pseudomonadota bacterium]